MTSNGNMTVYHRTVDPATRMDVYARQPVYHVLWEERKGVNVINSGLADADRVAVYVLLPHMAGVQIAPGDIIVRGICVSDITAQYTIAQLQRDNVSAVVTSVDCKDFGSPALQHYEIGGA